jgi:hypothetical protein
VILACVTSAIMLGATGLRPGSGLAATAPSCFPKGSKTLAATKRARVFQTRRGTYGCLYEYDRARRLDPPSPRQDIEATAFKPFRFAGSYVAYPRDVTQGCGPDLCGWTEVVVADLRPAKPLTVLKREAASDEDLKAFRDGASNFASGFITDLVLRPSGSVAWIECAGDTQGPCYPDADRLERAQTSVFAASPRRRGRTKLDEGAGIERRSLTWANGAFLWRNGGRRSARFR